MLNYAVIALAIAAVGGAIMALSVLRGQLAPWAISVLHALFAAGGLVLIIAALVNGIDNTALRVSVGILVVAALGGFYLGAQHLRKKVAPGKVVILHAGLAVTGFLVLLLAAFGQ